MHHPNTFSRFSTLAFDGFVRCQDALARVEKAMSEAEEASSKVLNEIDSDDDSEVGSVAERRPMPPPAVNEDDLLPLEMAVKNARKAGDTREQVCPYILPRLISFLRHNIVLSGSQLVVCPGLDSAPAWASSATEYCTVYRALIASNEQSCMYLAL